MLSENRLANEKSPYLLQHAHNPVDWYPWGEEAFEKARDEDKPVFLSVGYSTCHWCHVMAHESFEDAEVADILNREYVPVKVDREERPDIDAVYMAVCQALTGQGGWPLTVIMTPDQKPFFAGTYFPKHRRYSMPGLVDILKTVADGWKRDRAALVESGDRVAEAIRGRDAGGAAAEMPGERQIKDAYALFGRSFDDVNGGFGGAPRFPSPHNLLFLLRYHHATGDAHALFMAEKTLEQMYRGGIFDHIGFGFSRYSTDNRWLVPHFEKMLYDNALLTLAYLETYQITKKPLYKAVSEKIIAFVLREMTGDEGGFYSAQDADSEGVEGKYYVFDKNEIIDVLGQADGEAFCARFGVTGQGNFEGKNIPNLLDAPDFAAQDERTEQMCEKLRAYRARRTRLHIDDKILTAWNALMIAALARAHAVLGNQVYLDAAHRAAAFVEKRLTARDGRRLYTRYRDGEAAHSGTLDEYAFYVWAQIELYEADFDPAHLARALEINAAMAELFADDNGRGFFLSASEGERLILRPKEFYDGAMPSGNSVAAMNLVRLAALTGDPALEAQAQKQLEAFPGEVKSYPAGFGFYLCALMHALGPSNEIVCAAEGDAALEPFRAFLREHFLPFSSVLVRRTGDESPDALAPFIRDYRQKDGKTTYYVCANHACAAPVTNTDALAELITPHSIR
jgi:uncharacterized protein YyaL (SSP411 family)